MMSIPLQTASEITYAWTSSCDMPDAAPIYMGERYQSLLAAHDGSEVRLLSCSAGGTKSCLSMLVKEVGSGVYEAYSAYGYGGFFGELKLSNKDIIGLQNFLAEAGIVALFLRHSPFLFNQSVMPEGLRRLNRYTYAAELCAGGSFADYLIRAPQKLRWSANYALRAGLNVAFYSLSNCSKEKIQSFYKLYKTLMSQKEASDYYHFSESFFQEHARQFGENCELAEVTDREGRFLGGAFFLKDDSGWVHYHLSAVRREGMKLQAMELLMLSALHRFGERGYNALHLGGGHALDESDGLSRFKSKFASQKLEFHCSLLICDEAGYVRERTRLPLSRPSLFLISDARGTPMKTETASLARMG